MSTSPASSAEWLRALRDRAEAQRARAHTKLHTLSQAQDLLQELETYQLELELQNEELLIAQQAAEIARAEYTDLYEHAPVAYLTLTLTGMVERANQRACALLGTVTTRLVGRRFLVFVAPACRDAYANWQADLLAGRAPLSTELSVLTEDGALRLTQLEGVIGPDGTTGRLALLDMTEQRRAAAALRHSQEQARLALTASGAGVVEWEGAANSLFLDEQARFLLGLPGPGGYLPLTTLWQQVLPADRDTLLVTLNGAVEGLPLDLEFRVFDLADEPRYLAAHCEIVFEAGRRLRLIGLVRDVTARRQAQEEAARLRLHQQQAVFEAVLATQEEERRRMAESLHNGVGQLLYLLKLSLERPGSKPPADASRLLEEAIRDLRAVSVELAPPVLEDFGLQSALEALSQRVAPPLRVHYNFRGLRPAMPRPFETTIYRLVQELLNNVLKHAQAKEVFLHVVREGNLVDISVDDDGQGFSPSPPSTTGTGLASIRTQVTRLGGALRVVSQPGYGASVSIELPVQEMPLEVAGT
jgi:PAS domain S-box-containing protein